MPPGVSSQCILSGVYTLSGGSSRVERGKTFGADKKDQSAVLVNNKGDLTLHDPTVITSGQTTSEENSSFFGLNAAVLATKGSRITISGGSILTSGEGANGAFATDAGSTIMLDRAKIRATGSGGHGVMATNGGKLVLTDVEIETSGPHGAPVATDRGGGSISVRGGAFVSSGAGSPPVYSTGDISVAGARLMAKGSEGVVIEGANSVVLTDCRLQAEKLCGAMIYQSFSGDAEGQNGVFSMSGGSFAALEGPLFNVNNTRAVIILRDVDVLATTGVLIQAAAARWGHPGSNGGKAVFLAENQSLRGDFVADKYSSLDLSIVKGSSLHGAVNASRTASAVTLKLDGSSEWWVSADSYLHVLGEGVAFSGGVIQNIRGGGHNVYYKPAVPGNAWLKGQTYGLQGGGSLAPW